MNTSSRRWTANWIRSQTPQEGAPYLRATFDLARAPKRATAHILIPGWHELHVNGRRVGDAVLSPVPMLFDRHVPWLELDLAPYLRAGRNAVVFLLGNGWFNMFESDCWGFEAAPWRSPPTVLCEIVADGRVVLRTDESWRTAPSPLVYNGLRNGETWDARVDPTPEAASAPGFDDSAWKPAVRCVPPGGAPRRAEGRPSVALSPREAVAHKALRGEKAGGTVWDFGGSLAGWCEVEAEGEAGAKIEIEYGEKILPDGDLDRRNIDHLVNGNRFQRDEYILRGDGRPERWHARFTYHGFRWARTRVVEGRAKIRALRAIEVRTELPVRGTLSCADPVFARLTELTRRSYLDNFAGGFPTDCPHREKNGWTGDAQLAMETGLWTFEGDPNYRNQVRMLVDGQRANGAVPCIVPCATTFGYGWGTGPAWDAYLFEAPWQLLRFRGDDSFARELYGAMRSYLGYAVSMIAHGLVDFGLGDWCRARESIPAPERLTSSAYVMSFAQRFAFFARRFGHEADARRADALAKTLRANLRKEFLRPDGSWAEGGHTALGCALHFGLCEKGEEEGRTARLLAETVRAERHHAMFGILGAKWVPRALADHGYVDDAWKLFTQGEQPGYGHWVAKGATALHEDWYDESSLDHIMFGDLTAWAFEYLGGIRPSFERPGFSGVLLRPVFPKGLDRFEATHKTPHGEIAVRWSRKGKRIVYAVSLPAKLTASVQLPGCPAERVRGGKHEWTVRG